MKSSLKTEIRKRAFESFLERGGAHGRMIDDRIQAERETIGSVLKKTTPRNEKEVASEKK